MYCKGRTEPLKFPWAANPVLVKQGEKLSFCFDYRDGKVILDRSGETAMFAQ